MPKRDDKLPTPASFSEWLSKVRALAGHLDQLADGFEGTATALFAVWLTIDRAPPQIRDGFRNFDEDKLASAAATFDFGTLGFEAGDDASSIPRLQGVLLQLAIRLRALEACLMSIARPALLSTVVLVGYAGEEAFIILREARNRRPHTLQPSTVRALVSTRLILKRVGDFEVAFVSMNDPAGRIRVRHGEPLRLGAALFENLKLEEEPSEDGIWVKDAQAPDQLETIKRQLAAADAAGCSVVVYPELTISTSTLEELKDGLAEWPPTQCSVIVAGSLHRVEGDGQRYNVATILDANGEVHLEHRKLFRYLAKEDCSEAITGGNEIQILITEEAIYAFALCLDFCIRTEQSPYLFLDVDYILVPSLGNKATIDGHIKRSEDVLLSKGTRSAIVQQTYDGEAADPLGYAFVRTSRKVALSPDTVEVRLDWHSLEL